MKTKILAGLLLALGMVGMAQADTNDLTFTGTVGTACAFRTSQNGVLAIDPTNFDTFGSNVGSGQPGIVQIEYTGRPSLTVNGGTPFAYVGSGTPPTSYYQYQWITAQEPVNQAAWAAEGATTNGTWVSGQGSKTIVLTDESSTDSMQINMQAQQPNTPWVAGQFSSVISMTCS
jgi:hypothetical protein